MEQIQMEMRENQGKKNALRNVRALERQRKMPQNLQSTELEPSEGRYKGGGMAGLARVIGSGKKKREASPESVSSMSSGEGGAKHMGRMMYEHLAKLHGDKYASKFMTGGSAPRNQAPMGIQVAHASMTPTAVGLPGQALGGQDVPKGGLAPMAYGSAPQAPASFARNSVDVGSAGLLPLPSAQTGSGRRKAKHSAPSVHSTLNEMEGGRVALGQKRVYPTVAKPSNVVSGGKRAERGEMIRKLMKEKGLTLGQASKYLKENGSA